MKHFGRWLLVFAVERHDGQARFLVLAAVHLGAGVGLAAKTVFWRVDFSDVDA